MFENILLATDGSEYSHRAVEYARSLAECYEANLWLVHVFASTSDLLGYEDFEKLFAKRKSAGQAILDKAKENLIVDDEPDVVVPIQFLMEQQGYSVLTAQRGEDALDLIYRSREKTIQGCKTHFATDMEFNRKGGQNV